MLGKNSLFVQSGTGFYVDPNFEGVLSEAGIHSLDSVFAFQSGQNLGKPNLASWRCRIRFQLPNGQMAYLKRYDRPPVSEQLKSWEQHKKRALFSEYDKGPSDELKAAEVMTPQTIAYGGQWSGLFEKRSFIITLEIPEASSLEMKLPESFEDGQTKTKRQFVVKLADFIRRFHGTGYRHRDLYLCHIFLSENENLYLIDLHRSFRPLLLGKRYQVKDLAQLHYSSPADKVYWTDRLRFYLAYMQKNRLDNDDKTLIRNIHSKALRIARHDRKHGRPIPFERSETRGPA